MASQTKSARIAKEWRKAYPARRRAYGQRWRKENAEKVRDYVRRHRARRRPEILALKARPCLDCGGSYPPECMDFDHVRGTKVRGLSRMGSCAPSLVQAEIAKCDLVCANCHRIRTHKRRVALRQAAQDG